MNIIKRFYLTANHQVNLAVLIICFFAFSFLFAGCESESNRDLYQVSFFLGGIPFEGSTLEVKHGYKIPMTHETIAAHAGGRGLYKGKADDVDKFWVVVSGQNIGEIWDFQDPVLGDMMLMAEAGTPPEKMNLAGRGKEFFDNAMKYINDRDNAGSYILALGEDAGEREDEPGGIKYKEINRVTFSPGVDLTIIGIGKERTIHTIGSRVFVLPGNAVAPIKLTLGRNITIRGSEATSNQGMIRVGDGFGGNMDITFTMLDGSKITGYYSDRPGGGGRPELSVGSGVIVVYGSISMRNSNVLFHMKGGEITGNQNLWGGGSSSGGVTLNRAKMIMEGSAKITGNTGFGGDIAYGVNSHWPLADDLYIELKDEATIGRVYLFSSVAGIVSPASVLQPHIKIHDGWSGKIDSLYLGYGHLDGTAAPTLPIFWENTPSIRNAAVTGSAVGTVSEFIPNITLGGSFHWNSGRFWPNEYDDYRISTSGATAGRLVK